MSSSQCDENSDLNRLLKVRTVTGAVSEGLIRTRTTFAELLRNALAVLLGLAFVSLFDQSLTRDSVASISVSVMSQTIDRLAHECNSFYHLPVLINERNVDAFRRRELNLGPKLDGQPNSHPTNQNDLYFTTPLQVYPSYVNYIYVASESGYYLGAALRGNDTVVVVKEAGSCTRQEYVMDTESFYRTSEIASHRLYVEDEFCGPPPKFADQQYKSLCNTASDGYNADLCHRYSGNGTYFSCGDDDEDKNGKQRENDLCTKVEVYDHREMPWFQSMLDESNPDAMWSAAYPDKETNVTVVTAMHRVRVNGTWVVFAVDISLEDVSSLIMKGNDVLGAQEYGGQTYFFEYKPDDESRQGILWATNEDSYLEGMSSGTQYNVISNTQTNGETQSAFIPVMYRSVWHVLRHFPDLKDGGYNARYVRSSDDVASSVRFISHVHFRSDDITSGGLLIAARTLEEKTLVHGAVVFELSSDHLFSYQKDGIRDSIVISALAVLIPITRLMFLARLVYVESILVRKEIVKSAHSSKRVSDAAKSERWEPPRASEEAGASADLSRKGISTPREKTNVTVISGNIDSNVEVENISEEDLQKAKMNFPYRPPRVMDSPKLFVILSFMLSLALYFAWFFRTNDIIRSNSSALTQEVNDRVRAEFEEIITLPGYLNHINELSVYQKHEANDGDTREQRWFIHYYEYFKDDILRYRDTRTPLLGMHLAFDTGDYISVFSDAEGHVLYRTIDENSRGCLVQHNVTADGAVLDSGEIVICGYDPRAENWYTLLSEETTQGWTSVTWTRDTYLITASRRYTFPVRQNFTFADEARSFTLAVDLSLQSLSNILKRIEGDFSAFVFEHMEVPISGGYFIASNQESVTENLLGDIVRKSIFDSDDEVTTMIADYLVTRSGDGTSDNLDAITPTVGDDTVVSDRPEDGFTDTTEGSVNDDAVWDDSLILHQNDAETFDVGFGQELSVVSVSDLSDQYGLQWGASVALARQSYMKTTEENSAAASLVSLAICLLTALLTAIWTRVSRASDDAKGHVHTNPGDGEGFNEEKRFNVFKNQLGKLSGAVSIRKGTNIARTTVKGVKPGDYVCIQGQVVQILQRESVRVALELTPNVSLSVNGFREDLLSDKPYELLIAKVWNGPSVSNVAMYRCEEMSFTEEPPKTAKRYILDAIMGRSVLDIIKFEKKGDMLRRKLYYTITSYRYIYGIRCVIICLLMLGFYEAPNIPPESEDDRNEHRHWLRRSEGVILFALVLDLFVNVFVRSFRRLSQRSLIPRLRRPLIMQVLCLSGLLLDWLVRVAIGDYDTGYDASLMLPYSALLRPVLMVFSIPTLTSACSHLAVSLYSAKDAFAVLIGFVLVVTCWNIVLFAGSGVYEDSYKIGRGFDGYRDALCTTFTFVTTGENYSDVVYPAAASSESYKFYHMGTFFLGMMFLVSLIIATFQDRYTKQHEEVEHKRREARREGMLAAFVLLDEDDNKNLEYKEYVDFFTGVCNCRVSITLEDSNMFNLQKWCEVCETYASKFDSSSTMGHVLRFQRAQQRRKMRKKCPMLGAVADVLSEYSKLAKTDEKWFDELRSVVRTLVTDTSKTQPAPCESDALKNSSEELRRIFLVLSKLQHLHPQPKHSLWFRLRRKASVVPTQVVRFMYSFVWFMKKRIKRELGPSAAAGKGTTGEKAAERKSEAPSENKTGRVETLGCFAGDIRVRCTRAVSSPLYDYILKLVLVVHVWLIALMSTRASDIVPPILLGPFTLYAFMGLLKALSVSNAYTKAKDSKINEYASRFDSLILWGTSVLYLAKCWGDSSINFADADYTRVILALPTLRILCVFEGTRSVVFGVFIALPGAAALLSLLLLIMYLFAVMGSIFFAGAYEGVTDYDVPGATFDSMEKAFTTLFQMMGGDSWSTIMFAAVDATSSYLPILYFVGYVCVVTLLFSNLLIGVICDAFASLKEEGEGEEVESEEDHSNPFRSNGEGPDTATSTPKQDAPSSKLLVERNLWRINATELEHTSEYAIECLVAEKVRQKLDTSGRGHLFERLDMDMLLRNALRKTTRNVIQAFDQERRSDSTVNNRPGSHGQHEMHVMVKGEENAGVFVDEIVEEIFKQVNQEEAERRWWDI
eukprot:Rmarinus@m.2984